MKRIRLLLVMLLACGIGACASQSVDDHYYSLVLAADDSSTAAATTDAESVLIVGPVLLPDYLDQRSIVMQFGSSQLRGANHHFWAEPLSDGISKVLARDISELDSELAVERNFGRQGSVADCRLGIEFDKFHATDNATVVSSGRFWVTGNGPRVREEFDVTRRLSANGYGHAVDSLRESLRSVASIVSDRIEASAICAAPAR